MGKIFEALKQNGTKRCPTIDGVPLQSQWLERITHENADAHEEEIPFIEVGGPKSTMEASAAVLACVPTLKVPPPVPTQSPRVVRPAPVSPAIEIPVEQASSLPIGSPASPAKQSPSVRTPRAFMSVAFRPLSADSVRLGPAQERFAQELVAFHQPEHPISDRYRTLLGSLSEQMPVGQSQVLLFSAAASGVGTTNVVLNVAITFARQGKLRVAVVDANSHRPAVAQRFGLPAAPGLTEVLAGSTSLSQALQESGLMNLLALTAGSARIKGSQASAARSISELLQELHEHFDLVFVDGPCWEDKPAVTALGAASDAIYLVLSQQQSDAPETGNLIQDIRKQIAASTCQLRGCVLTQ